MGRADQFIADNESVIERTQMARTANILILLYIGALAAVIGAGVIAMDVITVPLLGPLAAALPAVLAAIMLAAAELKRYADAYMFTDEKVIHVSGIFNLDTTTIYFTDVTHTTVKQDIVGRILGHGDVYVDTAGQGGSEMVLTGVRDPEHFQQLLERKSGHGRERTDAAADTGANKTSDPASIQRLSQDLSRLQREQHRVEQAYQEQKLDDTAYRKQWYVLEGRIQQVQELIDRLEGAE